MPKLSIELNRPEVRLPEGLRDTVEHLPGKLSSAADVRNRDVDLSKLTEVARNVADKVSERAQDLSKIELPSEIEIKLPARVDLSKVEMPRIDPSKLSMPKPEDVGDAARSLADRLPHRRRRSPWPMFLSIAVIASVAAILANWSTVRPWLAERVATARSRMNDVFPMDGTDMDQPTNAGLGTTYPTSGTGTDYPVTDEPLGSSDTGPMGTTRAPGPTGTIADTTMGTTTDPDRPAWTD